MASLHFIVTAPVVTQGDNREVGRQVALEVEVEWSSVIKSKADLVRAARAIAASEIARGMAEAEVLGEFTVTETKQIVKNQDSPLTSADWPGVTIWRVSSEPPLAA